MSLHRRTRGRLLAGFSVIAAILLHRGWRGCTQASPPPPPGAIRIATWNLENFPSPAHDRGRLRREILALDADLLAVQEIHDERALAEIAPGYTILLTERGGRHGQRLGVAYRPSRFEPVFAPFEHGELALGGAVRPAFSVRLRIVPAGPELAIVVVHLKSGSSGLALRRQQWPRLARIVTRLRDRDPNVVVLGDFNGAGGAPEHAELAAIFGSVGLRPIPSDPCSAYWDGSRRDAWKEPSLLDRVWVSGFDRSIAADTRAHAHTHCAKHACQPFWSTDAYPELDFTTLSDHCPIVVDLRPYDPIDDANEA